MVEVVNGIGGDSSSDSSSDADSIDSGTHVGNRKWNSVSIEEMFVSG